MSEQQQRKPQHAGQIRDVRGRKVTQFDPVAAHLLHEHHVIEADVLGSIVREPGVGLRTRERAALIGGVCALLLVVGLFMHALVIAKDFGSAPFARTSSLLYFAMIPWIIWFSLKRARFGKIRAAMLKYLRCPHCGYDLRMLPRDPDDGATVCPECGCAWQLPDAANGGEGDRQEGLT